MSLFSHRTSGFEPGSDTATARPQLDLMQPLEVATATFALG